MIKIDLVTGFLGSGKTTFIKKYAKYLTDQGYHIGIVENDFGAINIDMLLLQDIESEQCDLEPIVGGNDETDWKRRFKAKLILFALQGVDRVLVEPSGIYDVNTFKEIVYDDSVSSKYEIGNIFTLVDARFDEHLSEQAESLLVSQIANCGKVLLSNVNNVTPKQIRRTVDHISELLMKYHCDRDINDCVFEKDFNEMTEADYQKLMNSGWSDASYKSLAIDKEEIFTSLFFMNKQLAEDKIEVRLQQLMNDPRCGYVFRVKGFFRKEDNWIEVNATKKHLDIREVPVGQEVVIVIGEELNKEEIEMYFN